MVHHWVGTMENKNGNYYNVMVCICICIYIYVGIFIGIILA